jgi:two-component system OmpR family sensor kinase
VDRRLLTAPLRLPVAAGAIGLAGALAATLALHGAAAAALDRVLEERLRGAGETAARLLGGPAPDPAALRATMDANGLEGAYVVDRDHVLRADAAGRVGRRIDLLRVDPRCLAQAFAGAPAVGSGYMLGDLAVTTGCFPVRAADGAIPHVLVLEAGQAFVLARRRLAHALWLAVGLSALAGLALALVARRFVKVEARASAAAARAARGDAVERMGATVAHEVRNPIGVIRGLVELVRARAGPALAAADREALADILGEVERLRRLTEDFLDLSREPILHAAPVDLAQLAAEAAGAAARVHAGVRTSVSVPSMTVSGDPGRLRQVLANLLDNAARAGARTVALTGRATDGVARLEVRDDGPGVDPALRHRLFDPFVTGSTGGTGLGLAVARRIAERHGGSLELVEPGPAGAAFVLVLPLAGPEA